MTGLLETWRYVAKERSREIIFPDGCQDLVLTRHEDGTRRCFVSDLQIAPRYAEIPRGSSMVGFRLKPGTMIDVQALVGCAKDHPEDIERLTDLVHETCFVPADIEQVLVDLASASGSVAEVARRNGVSLRGLQRLFKQAGLRPPEFWRVLARVRRAAARVTPATVLAEMAFDEGFADQAHMTREFQRWLTLSPAMLRADRRLQDLVRQSGLGTCLMGEQISTR